MVKAGRVLHLCMTSVSECCRKTSMVSRPQWFAFASMKQSHIASGDIALLHLLTKLSCVVKK